MKHFRWLWGAAGIALVGAVAWRVFDRVSHANEVEEASSPRVALVRAVEVREGPIQSWVFGEGTARATRREFLHFEQSGRVVFVKKGPDGEDLREGSLVQGPKEEGGLGELLARLDDREVHEEIRVARADLAEAEQRHKAAIAEHEQALSQSDYERAELKRREELWESRTISESAFEAQKASARQAEAQVHAAASQVNAAHAGISAAEARIHQSEVALERTRIYAPFDGVAAYVNVREGQYFSPNMIDASSEDTALNSVPFVILKTSSYEITLDVPVFDGKRVTIGQDVLIGLSEDLSSAQAEGAPQEETLSLYRGRGRVFSVNPAINPGGRSIQVKVRTEGTIEGLLDGAFISCRIEVESRESATVIPNNALIYRENRPYTFVIDSASGRVEQRRLRLGIEGLAGLEVLEGAKPGELLVTDGRHLLVSGAPVEVVGDEGGSGEF